MYSNGYRAAMKCPSAQGSGITFEFSLEGGALAARRFQREKTECAKPQHCPAFQGEPKGECLEVIYLKTVSGGQIRKENCALPALLGDFQKHLVSNYVGNMMLVYMVCSRKDLLMTLFHVSSQPPCWIGPSIERGTDQKSPSKLNS